MIANSADYAFTIENTAEYDFMTANRLNMIFTITNWERSGIVVECLIRDREAAGLSLTGVTVLWSLSKAHLS